MSGATRTGAVGRVIPLVLRSLLTRVVVVINGKGGVGKTTLAANIAGLLAMSGYKVLLGDLDPQGNVGFDLGYADTDVDDRGQSLAAALLFGQPVNIVKDVRPGLDVIVGGSALHHASAALAAARPDSMPRDALARVLEPHASEYDVILVDCPPGNESLQTAAIAAARWALVPSAQDEASKRGLTEVSERLEGVLDINPDLDLLGVVIFGIGKSATTVDANARRMVTETIGAEDKIFATTVRHSDTVAEQVRKRGLLVHELDEFARAQPEWWKVLRGEVAQTERVSRTASNVADDLHAVTQEFVQRLTAGEAAEVQP